ncbi:unnamed protein product [Cuscuta epithymum]|uniref:Uncharacterized protein n=1 Tax=Cuscuta epithymum TaxID=186058 RepID=A0AAV0ELE5_9ASTE|nr:unnamed protein product [Cuscuta epithymum]
MAKWASSTSRTKGKQEKNGKKLNIVMEKLQRSLLLRKRSPPESPRLRRLDESKNARGVPDDVKEGHFAVMAMDDGGKLKRFVVPLSCLAHPSFVRLLDRAAEEFGFEREGAIIVPCKPMELQKIIQDQQWAEKLDLRFGLVV